MWCASRGSIRPIPCDQLLETCSHPIVQMEADAVKCAVAFVSKLGEQPEFRELVAPITDEDEIVLFALAENVPKTSTLDCTSTPEQKIHRDHDMGFGTNFALVLDVFGQEIGTRIDIEAHESDGHMYASGKAGRAATSTFAFDLYTPHWGKGYSNVGRQLVRGRYFLQFVSKSTASDDDKMDALRRAHHLKTHLPLQKIRLQPLRK